MKRNTKIITCMGIASGLAVASIGFAENTGQTPTTGAAGTSSLPAATSELIADASAINFLHHTNNLEVQESNEALQRLQDPNATALAQAIVTDHQQNEQQVLQLASQKSWALYSFEPSTYELAEQATLRNLPATTYDQAFLEHERMGHQEVLTKLQDLQGRITDPDLKALITSTIPVIQKHLQMAGGSPGTAANPTPSSSPSAGPSQGPSSSPGSTPSNGGTGPGGSSGPGSSTYPMIH